MSKKYTLDQLESLAERMIKTEHQDAIDLCDNLGQIWGNISLKYSLIRELVTNNVRYPQYSHLEREWYAKYPGASFRSKANIGTYGITDDDEVVDGLWYPPLDVEFHGAYQLSCGYVEQYTYENLHTILFQEHQQYCVQQFLRVNHESTILQEKIFDIEDGYVSALDFFILISGVRWMDI
jgi:hypothetical protein